jgi:hypothetical protein
VLKGISFEEAKEFEQELEEIGIVSFHKIKSFKNPNLEIKKVKLVCDNEIIAQNLMDNGITLNYIHYYIEEFKNTVKIVQCYTCQKIEHISRNCRTKIVTCRICGSTEHEIDENGRPICNNKENKKCQNCEGPHTSSYAGCPKKKEIIKNIHEKINAKHNPNSSGKKSYAAALTGSSNGSETKLDQIQNSLTELKKFAWKIKNLQTK